MKYSILFLVLLITSCTCSYEKPEPSLVFENDGCKIYKFYDQRWIYYSTCRGTVSSSYTSGKSTVYDDVPTEVRK